MTSARQAHPQFTELKGPQETRYEAWEEAGPEQRHTSRVHNWLPLYPCEV